MVDLEDVRRRWLEDRPRFAQFGEELVGRLKDAVRGLSVWAEVSGRAKDMDSLIRKLIKKSSHTYETVGDLCGVRVIVRYKGEVDDVLGIALKLFNRGEPENTVDRLDYAKVGYLSSHAELRLYETDRLSSTYPPDMFRAELQVRTLAQHLWSEMSHDTVYKNDETLVPLTTAWKRRVYLLAGTIELADNEFDRLSSEMPKIPEVDLLKSLERQYYKLTTRRPDADLSLSTIRWLYPLYELGVHEIESRMEELWSREGSVLQGVYDRANENPASRSAFFFQPEALMIYDLLITQEWNLRQAWSDHDMPIKELERMANDFGISFDS